jgi:predicted DNA-binding transcriptional regulator AlpA
MPKRRRRRKSPQRATLGPAVLRTEAAALYTGTSASFLEKARLTGGGPKFLRLTPRAVGYRVSDLDKWLEERCFASTSAADMAPRRG